jgi:hypothetical protein
MAKYMQLTDGTVIQTDSPEIWTEAKPMSAKAGKEAYREQAREKLRKLLPVGSTAFTILRHVSGSGMSRRISVLIPDKECGILDVSGWVATALDYRRHERDGGVIVGGCGMDMGWHLVYCLSRSLYPDGFKVDGVGRNGDTSGRDTDGGYALKHRWI